MICPKCGAQINDNSVFCTRCGAKIGETIPPAQTQPTPTVIENPQVVYADPKDHTAEFSPKDISDNKVLAMLPYLMGLFGVIIALLATRESAYTYFHVRQALKIDVATTLTGIITLLLCWTVIVPFVGAVAVVALFVIRIICFFQVCKGKAKEPALVSELKFLK